MRSEKRLPGVYGEETGGKASQPEKPRKRSLEELATLDREGAGLTPEEAERLAAG